MNGKVSGVFCVIMPSLCNHHYWHHLKWLGGSKLV